MSVEHSNQAGRIIAEAIIESAALYSETLKEASQQMESALAALHRQFYAEKQRCEEEIARLQQAIKDQDAKPKPVPQPVPKPDPKPEPKPKPEQPSTKDVFKDFYRTIKELSIEQRQAKAERNMKKFQGKRKYPTESDAQKAVSRNSVELRILWTIVTGRTDFQGIESTRHPLHKHIEKINEYKRQCGQPELKVEVEPEKKPDKKPVQVTYGVKIAGNYTEKLTLIKAVKELLNIGLKEAKDIVDKGPVIIPNGLKKEEAERIVSGFAKRGYLASIIIADA
jgi:large subunit ribosomal protein L7/L12